MIEVSKVRVVGWEPAVRGTRNPMNSWEKSDSNFSCETCDGCYYESEKITTEGYGTVDCWCNNTALRIGPNDLALMTRLANAGPDHGKFLRMITIYMDINAPLYWWKEFDTYKVGTVANSCSTMHKILSKEFELEDFSHEHLCEWAKGELECVIEHLNHYRYKYNNYEVNEGYTKKDCWWQMIQLLPSSYNQKRTVQLNYQVLKSMYHARKNHKLDEWIDFCKWCETLPYFKEICIE